MQSEILQRIKDFIERNQIDPLLADDLNNYVYAIYSSGEKYPFYVGKGVGQRVLQHFGEAINDLFKSGVLSDRSHKLQSIIDAFKDEASEPEIRIIRRNLNEEQVEAVEAALIDALEPIGNKVRGLGSVEDGIITLKDLKIINGAKPVSPSIDYRRIYLYNIEKGYKERKCYVKALRGDWKSNRFTTDLDKFKANGGKAFAVGLVKGISRSVIEVHSWESSIVNPKRLQIIGPESKESELLHMSWSKIIKNFGFWKWSGNLVIQFRCENDSLGFCVIHGDGDKTKQFYKLD